ncbi:MAG: hypothetical protein KF895_14485 [Parvibaculum sp.]|nr:hypothetical protein [Parvibaculum sp.]
MTDILAHGHTVLDRRFHPEPAGRASAGAFGRRSFGRASPPPATEFEVERILSRCRARRVEVNPGRNEGAQPRSSELRVYAAAAASLLAFCVLSVLPVF